MRGEEGMHTRRSEEGMHTRSARSYSDEGVGQQTPQLGAAGQDDRQSIDAEDDGNDQIPDNTNVTISMRVRHLHQPSADAGRGLYELERGHVASRQLAPHFADCADAVVLNAELREKRKKK